MRTAENFFFCIDGQTKNCERSIYYHPFFHVQGYPVRLHLCNLERGHVKNTDIFQQKTITSPKMLCTKCKKHGHKQLL